jgi:hypothetical protein
MLYSTVGGAVTMFLINLFMAVVTSGMGFILTWPICIIWGAVAASEHNQRLFAGSRR